MQHGLGLTAVHHLAEYKPGKSFSWFPEEVANARRKGDQDPPKNNWVMSQN